MNVKCFRLVTGEDIMAEFEDVGDSVKWKNPVQISMVRSGSTPTFGFLPFPMYTGQNKNIELTIEKKYIIFDSQADDEFVQQYNSIFGAGIITPSKSILVN